MKPKKCNNFPWYKNQCRTTWARSCGFFIIFTVPALHHSKINTFKFQHSIRGNSTTSTPISNSQPLNTNSQKRGVGHPWRSWILNYRITKIRRKCEKHVTSTEAEKSKPHERMTPEKRNVDHFLTCNKIRSTVPNSTNWKEVRYIHSTLNVRNARMMAGWLFE